MSHDVFDPLPLLLIIVVLSLDQHVHLIVRVDEPLHEPLHQESLNVVFDLQIHLHGLGYRQVWSGQSTYITSVHRVFTDLTDQSHHEFCRTVDDDDVGHFVFIGYLTSHHGLERDKRRLVDSVVIQVGRTNLIKHKEIHTHHFVNVTLADTGQA